MHQKIYSASASLAWALVFTASVGCGGPQKKDEPTTFKPTPTDTTPTTTEPETPTKPPEVLLRLDGKISGKEAHELAPGESLRSGDQLAVNVTVNQPAYVYVAFASAAGTAQLVYPKGEPTQLKPDSPLRIPSNPEKWITLDKQTGQEDVMVYASNKPIPSTDLTNMVNADAAAAKKAAAKKVAKGPPKVKIVKAKGDSDALSAGSRGVTMDDDDGDAAPTNTNPNIVVKRFSIQHK